MHGEGIRESGGAACIHVNIALDIGRFLSMTVPTSVYGPSNRIRAGPSKCKQSECRLFVWRAVEVAYHNVCDVYYIQRHI